MIEKGGGEVVDAQAELVEHGSNMPARQEPGFSEDRIDAICKLGENVERLGKAMDKIRRFVLARALPGDWCKFGDGTTSYLELSSAGAERIGNDLGIGFTGWKSWKEEGEDKLGRWFYWYYSCDISFNGRKMESIEGRAGSRDKFFGYKEGAWKELEDVKEADIRQAARRRSMQEGIRQLLGIRRIPAEAAKTLGLNPDIARGYSFASKRDDSGHRAPTGPQKGILKFVKSYLCLRVNCVI